jgi:hypothetical protein
MIKIDIKNLKRQIFRDRDILKIHYLINHIKHCQSMVQRTVVNELFSSHLDSGCDSEFWLDKYSFYP